MDIIWLQDFLTIAETRNFTKAAQRRNSSQAAFSRRIQSLEAWLGAPLIDRSIFPVELTPQGQRFREHARDLLGQILDARLSLTQGSATRHDHVSVAMPHAIGTGRFSRWWRDWTRDISLTCDILPGNVGDAVNAFISGAADILIYYHNSQQPLHLDTHRYEQIGIATDVLRPYGAKDLVAAGTLALPPSGESISVPVLNYGAESYLARMVDLILDSQAVKLNRVALATCSMAEVLREMAVAGMGIAWLPDSVVDERSAEKLAVVGNERWTMSLSIIAYRDRQQNTSAVDRLWQKIKSRQVYPARESESRNNDGSSH